MQQAKAAVVMVTVSGRDEADKIASALLETHKAACINIVAGVLSRFWWQGKIDTVDELLLIIKTKVGAVPDIIRLVKDNHSYTVPEVIALPVIEGSGDYLAWIDSEVME